MRRRELLRRRLRRGLTNSSCSTMRTPLVVKPTAEGSLCPAQVCAARAGALQPQIYVKSANSYNLVFGLRVRRAPVRAHIDNAPLGDPVTPADEKGLIFARSGAEQGARACGKLVRIQMHFA